MVENGSGYVCFVIFYNDFGIDEFFLALEMEEEFAEIFYAIEGNTRDEGSLSEVVEGEIDFGNTGGFCRLDDVDDAVNGAEFAGKGEFAYEETVFYVFGAELIREEHYG